MRFPKFLPLILSLFSILFPSLTRGAEVSVEGTYFTADVPLGWSSTILGTGHAQYISANGWVIVDFLSLAALEDSFTDEKGNSAFVSLGSLEAIERMCEPTLRAYSGISVETLVNSDSDSRLVEISQTEYDSGVTQGFWYDLLRTSITSEYLGIQSYRGEL